MKQAGMVNPLLRQDTSIGEAHLFPYQSRAREEKLL